MPATVPGTYKNWQIVLDEELPIKSNNAKVIVTVVKKTSEKQEKLKRQFGPFESGIYPFLLVL